ERGWTLPRARRVGPRPRTSRGSSSEPSGGLPGAAMMPPIDPKSGARERARIRSALFALGGSDGLRPDLPGGDQLTLGRRDVTVRLLGGSSRRIGTPPHAHALTGQRAARRTAV